MSKILLKNLTIGEIKYLEKTAGVPVQQLGDLLADETQSYLPALSALAFIGLRRTGNPTPSQTDVDDVSMEQIMEWFELGESDPESLPASENGQA